MDEGFAAITDGLFTGTFSASPEVVFIDSLTAQINVDSTGEGLHYITYTVDGYCSVTRQIFIGTPPDGAFAYPNESYTTLQPDPSPNFAPEAIAGTFSASPAGLVFVNSSTGEIDLDASIPNTYVIYNTISFGGCFTTDSFTLTIEPLCEKPQNPLITSVTSTSATFTWNAVDYAVDYFIYLVTETDTSTFENVEDTTLTFSGLIPGSHYRAFVMAKCGIKTSPKSDNVDFNTYNISIYDVALNQIKIFPNPATDLLNIFIPASLQTQAAYMVLKDISGKVLLNMNISSETEQIKTDGLDNGFYLLQIISDFFLYTEKVVFVNDR